MVNKQDFKNYKAQLQITIGNKITKAINKLNVGITVKLENNKDQIIQSLRMRFHRYRTVSLSLKVKPTY